MFDTSCADTSCAATSESEFGASCSSNVNNIEESTGMLVNMFPHVSVMQARFLLEITNGDCDVTCNAIIEGLTVERILSLWKHPLEVRRISLETYKTECAQEELLSFYKSRRFTPFSTVRVCIQDQQAIDTGGVRRQLYGDALCKISSDEDLFEQRESGIYPVFRHSTMSSGIFGTIGKIIGHAIIMDNLGFPYLSPALYYYMASHLNLAVSAITMGDLGSNAEHIVSKVHISLLLVSN